MSTIQTNLGRNARRTLVADAIVTVSVGTDDTTPTATDTALGTQLLPINAIESRTDGATGISVVRTRFLAADAVGTWAEAGAWTVAPALMDHITFSPLIKTNAVEVLVDITYEVT